MESSIEEWEQLAEEYKNLEGIHNSYCKQLAELHNTQNSIIKQISHQRYRLKQIKTSIKKLHLVDEEEKQEKDYLNKDLLRRHAQLTSMETILPKPNDAYLNIVLGSVNVSILNEDRKFKYKEEYEKFKLIVNLIGMFISIFNMFCIYRVVDLLFMFLLVWYYCTLTIRESILVVNGSRIRGWWRLHHFISTVTSGILLIWPVGEVYYAFRTQFMVFNVYLCLVQYVQTTYQRGSLYRLKVLGQRDSNMDITIDGFHSWMWKGLGFLLPFLYIAYVFEMYNAYTLYTLIGVADAEWHVPALSILFLILSVGNTIMTSMVIPKKISNKISLRHRFTRLDKYFFNHKKRRNTITAEDDAPDTEDKKDD